MPQPVPRPLLARVAKELLLSFPDLPGWADAKPGPLTPLYDTDGSVAYYEVPFTGADGKDRGYAILSATEDDLPVVEFSESARSYSARFTAKLGRSPARILWFGPAYVVAEDAGGQLEAELGDRPSLMPAPLERPSRAEASNRFDVPTAPPPTRRPPPTRALRNWSYSELKTSFVRRRPPGRILTSMWKAAKSPNSPCVTTEYPAATPKRTHFLQIPKNTPPNGNDHWSGCGPTAWMNLYGWHDQNWCTTLLPASPTRNADGNVNGLTMGLHDYLGTYEPWWTFGADGGFTWPDDMPKGIEFAASRLGHSCSYWYRHDWWNTDEVWVYRVARDAAAHRRPFIVGYYSDRHYAIGYKVRECTKHGWQEHSWIRIYPAWDANDSGDKWIPMGTIFGVYAIYDFTPLLPGAVGNQVTAYDWSSGWTVVETYSVGGNTYLFLLKKGDGRVVIHRMNANGSVGIEVASYDWSDGWTQARAFTVGGSSFLFLLKRDNGSVHIHQIDDDGTIGARVAEYDWASGWTSVAHYVAGGHSYLLLLRKDSGDVHIHRMSANGAVGERVATYDWSAGWTEARAYECGGSSFLLLLKEAGGVVHIHRINNDGTIGARTATYDWSDGWSSVALYPADARTCLFLLKEDGGTVHVHYMNADGTVGTQIDARDWSDGWTSAVPFSTGGAEFLFLLKQDDGTVHIHHRI